MAQSEKLKALEGALSQIEKSFGKGSVVRLGARPVEAIPVISTGSISIDAALGVGGVPRGRVVEIFGPESSGKTTIALQIIAACQLTGGQASFVDAEHALDPSYAKKLGVDIDNLLVSQPDNGEQALIWSDPVNLHGCGVMFVYRGQGQRQPGQFERRLISLIFAGRNRMVMIRRELPPTRVASPAEPVA